MNMVRDAGGEFWPAREVGLQTARAAGKSSPVPDACAFGVPRDQCRLRCGYRCSRARADRAAGRPTYSELQNNLLTLTASPMSGTGGLNHDWSTARPVPDLASALPSSLRATSTASPSVAADHANCGTNSCCRRCTPAPGDAT